MIRFLKKIFGIWFYLLNVSYFDININGINMLMGCKWYVSIDYKIWYCFGVVICFIKGVIIWNDFYMIFK